MSDFDVWLKRLVLSIVVPTVVLIILWLLLKRPLNRLKKKFMAYILNRMVACTNNKIGAEKEELFGPLWALKGDSSELTLLEIGAGSGANFKYYPRGTSVICVDPNDCFQSYLEDNVSQYPHITLKQFIIAKGEDMGEVPDNFCDAVVCTLVLCSVDDVALFIKEVKRVLRPGGTFFFLEHVAAPSSSWSYTLQCLLNPVWTVVSDGCRINQKTWCSIDSAGFDNVEYRRFQLSSWVVPLKYLMMGIAIK